MILLIQIIEIKGKLIMENMVDDKMIERMKKMKALDFQDVQCTS